MDTKITKVQESDPGFEPNVNKFVVERVGTAQAVKQVLTIEKIDAMILSYEAEKADVVRRYDIKIQRLRTLKTQLQVL